MCAAVPLRWAGSLSFVIASSSEDAEGYGRNRGSGSERLHVWEMARAQQRRLHHALFPLTRSGAQTGVALHLFDAEIAERERMLDILQRHVFAAAYDDFATHDKEAPVL